MITETNNSTRERIARLVHANCSVCVAGDPDGLGLQFAAENDGSMTVIFPGKSRFQGYMDRLHGGIIATLFDAAMTHCLFARGLAGVTAALTVRFLQPVEVDNDATVNVRVVKTKSRLYVLEGTLHQEGMLKATAEAKFWSEFDIKDRPA